MPFFGKGYHAHAAGADKKNRHRSGGLRLGLTAGAFLSSISGRHRTKVAVPKR